jgi:energy-coupling factor transporter transmembrane protein EcfT
VNGNATATKRPRRETELTFLRLVPRDSIVRRLWAGTKILLIAELALMVSISPTWPILGIAGGVVLLGLLLAHIPLGAFPRLPNWFFGALAIGAVLSLLAATKPIVHVGGMSLSIGGLNDWAQFLVFAVVLVTSGALVGWTTPLGEVAPALAQLGTPLRKLRLPVDEWVVAIALAIRCLPLLIDEIRTLAAARKLRAHEPTTPSRGSARQVLIEAHDLMATAIVVSIRRGRDLADAMTARGGMNGVVSAVSRRPRLVDYFALATMTALGVVCLFVLHL